MACFPWRMKGRNLALARLTRFPGGAFAVALAGLVTLAGGWTLSPTTQMIYERSTRPLGATPSSWTTIHRAWNNDNAFVDRGAPVEGPWYLLRLPTLVSSDSPVVDHRLFVNLSVPGSNPVRTDPGMVLALHPQNGRVLWDRKTSNSVPSEPIVDRGLVIVGQGNAVFRTRLAFPLLTLRIGMVRGTGPSAVYALSARTGRRVWEIKTAGSDQPSPTVVGNTVYVVNGSRQLLAVDLHTGRIRWHANLGVYVSRSSPRIAGGRLYVGGGGPNQVVAFSLRTHRRLWHRRIPGAIGAVDDTPLALADGRLYGEAMVGSPYLPLQSPFHSEHLFALNAATGRILWTRRLAVGPEPRYKQGATAMIHGHMLFVGNAINGTFDAFNAVTGKRLWTIRLPDPVTRPAVWVHGRVVGVTSHGLLFAIGQHGHGLRTVRIARWVNAFGPVLVDRTLFVTGNTPYQGFLAAIPLSVILPSQS